MTVEPPFKRPLPAFYVEKLVTEAAIRNFPFPCSERLQWIKADGELCRLIAASEAKISGQIAHAITVRGRGRLGELSHVFTL